MGDLLRILTEARLQQYYDALVEAGLDDVDAMVQDVHEDEAVVVSELLEVVKMKPPHVRKIIRFLREGGGGEGRTNEATPPPAPLAQSALNQISTVSLAVGEMKVPDALPIAHEVVSMPMTPFVDQQQFVERENMLQYQMDTKYQNDMADQRVALEAQHRAEMAGKETELRAEMAAKEVKFYAKEEASNAETQSLRNQLRDAQTSVDTLNQHVDLLTETLAVTKDMLSAKIQEVNECEYQWAAAKAKCAQCESDKMEHESDVVHVLEPIICQMKRLLPANLVSKVNNRLDDMQQKRFASL